MALESGGFRVVAECADGPSAVAGAVEHRPEVCLLDVQMPGGGGIQAAAEIHTAVPEATIVMLTVSLNEVDLFDALKAGASGYLVKDADPARLCAALNGVLAGEGALPRRLVARLITEFRKRDSRHTRLRELENAGIVLTRREWEVLELLAEGKTTSEIAVLLDVAQVTVRSHVATVLKKLRVPSREEAVRRLAGGVDESQR
jgi:DNA-binding NarL/FixJ family response regulator